MSRACSRRACASPPTSSSRRPTCSSATPEAGSRPRGAALPEEFVYREDARRRAEFKNRPQLHRVLADAASGRFDAVLVRDETPLGGDMLRVGLLIQDLLDADVRLFYYFTNEEVRFDNPTQKLVVAVRNYAAELEREKISSRVHEHLKTKASDRYNAGDTVYGYDNQPVFVDGPDGKPRKLRTEYVINEAEAEVIRRIFALYAQGTGLRVIATKLNEDAVPSPRAGRRGSGSWAFTTVNSILANRRYLGFVLWNKMEKTYRRGTKVRIERPRDEWMQIAAPQLRIVSDELWASAQARRPGKRLDATGKRVGGLRSSCSRACSAAASAGARSRSATRGTAKRRSAPAPARTTATAGASSARTSDAAP